ncbi:MAG: 50S ribosomal protein L32 [Deltaproteobacteria bacterium]|nr:50S ribosomal protein L32 [Deltaproteobacteria bacterium]
MAVPKRRKSKARKNTRRSHDRVTLPNVILCPQCNEPKMPHRVCPSCGVYKGEAVLEVEG